MRALLHLYPRAWRERYGDELVALLEDRPPSPLDLVDLVRGAFDARLHPQLPGAQPATPERKNPMSDRLPGFAAIGGGLLFLSGVAMVGLAPLPTFDGYRETGLALPAILLGLPLIDVALIAAAVRRRGGAWGRVDTWLAIIAVGSTVVSMTGWPGLLFGFLTLIAVTATIVALYLRNAGAPLWVVAGAIVATILATFANTEDDRIWLMAPIGLLAVVFGLMSALRPRPSASAEPA
jgi:hypothetical protein